MLSWCLVVLFATNRSHATSSSLRLVFVGQCRYGIWSTGDGSVIARNTVLHSAQHGLLIQGGRTLVEGNQASWNYGCGLSFTGSYGTNAYRDNMLRGNGTGSVCVPGTNTDAGGNLY